MGSPQADKSPSQARSEVCPCPWYSLRLQPPSVLDRCERGCGLATTLTMSEVGAGASQVKTTGHNKRHDPSVVCVVRRCNTGAVIAISVASVITAYKVKQRAKSAIIGVLETTAHPTEASRCASYGQFPRHCVLQGFVAQASMAEALSGGQQQACVVRILFINAPLFISPALMRGINNA